MSWTRKSRPGQKTWFEGKHAFEHWYRDNQVYFITARCKDRFAAFAQEQAKLIFWEQFERYTAEFGFVPGVTSLLDNHYHTLGYLRLGENLGPMMQRIHGSVSKLVNDTMDVRLVPFWTDTRRQSYFDGCIRHELQCRRAYQYTLTQAVRHGICADWREYRHTRMNIEIDRGIARAIELNAFLTGVPYKRYGEGGPAR